MRLISYEGVKLIKKKKFVVIMSVKLEVTEMRFSVILYKNNIQRVDQFSVVCCFIDIDICKYEKPGVVRGHNKGIR